MSERKKVRCRKGHWKTVRALCIVTTMLIAPWLGEALIRPPAIDGKEGNAFGVPQISLETVLSDTLYQSSPAETPAGFEDEVFSLAPYTQVQVSSSGGVVGFSMAEDNIGAFRVLSHALAGKGWTKVASGMDSASSFIKREGAYTWLYLSCMEVGDTTSVVVQIR